MSQSDQGDVVDGQEITSRRNVLIGGASLAALAWAAPAITRMPGSYARGTDDLCDPDTSGERILGPSDTSFIVPLGVSIITVEVWGAGGNGAAGTPSVGGGGGGGGGYTRTAGIEVVACSEYAVTVGAQGSAAASTFNGPTIVSAPGGASASAATGAGGGVGGTANGGGGGNGVSSANTGAGGGGGEAGGPNGVGGAGDAGSGDTGGQGGSGKDDAGDGGSGGNRDLAGSNGLPPGGGGGGGGRGTGRPSGGLGAAGQIRITWTS